MWKNFKISNFKAFRNLQEVPLAPITLIYGPNSGGKSSIIQALLLLKQTIQSEQEDETLISRGKLVDLGSFAALVHQHDTTLPLIFELSFTSCVKEISTTDITVRLEFKGEPRREGVSRARLHEVFLRFSNKQKTTVAFSLKAQKHPSLQKIPRFSTFLFHLENYKTPKEDIGRSDTALRLTTEQVVDDVNQQGHKNAVGWVRLFRSKDLVQWAEGMVRNKDLLQDYVFCSCQKFFPMLALPMAENGKKEKWQFTAEFPFALPFSLVHGAFRAVSSLGAFRQPLKRISFQPGGNPSAVGPRGENVAALLLQNRGRLNEHLDRWLKRFQIPYSMDVKAGGDEIVGDLAYLTLVDDRTSTRVMGPDVGFGIGQLLPLLVKGLTSKNEVICIEQPETHLHPRLQADLGDFFMENAGIELGSGKTGPHWKNQWIIETHSETLILRLQKHIRKGRIRAEDIAVLYVEPGSAGSRILHLRLDQSGEFMDEWSDGFFEEGYRELLGKD